MQAAAARRRHCGMSGAVKQAGVSLTAVRVDAAVVADHLFPGGPTRLVDGRISQRGAVQLVPVQVDHDLVAVFDQGYRAAEGRFRSHVTNDQTYRSAGEPRIGHQPHDNAPLSAERGNARGRIEHLRHSRRTARTLVAYNDHVIVLDPPGRSVEGIEQALLALEHTRFAATDVALKTRLDPGKFENRGKVGR